MKKLNILLLSVVAMGSTFVSCTKEEASSSDNKENIEIPSDITLTGKWNFVKISEKYATPYNYPAGWALADTQCEGTPDYLYFKDQSTIVYGNADMQNTGCTVTTMSMAYSKGVGKFNPSLVGSPTSFPTMYIQNMLGSGQNPTFYVIKNTDTELNLGVIYASKPYIYYLTKAE